MKSLLNKLFDHQKLNYDISYRFRNKHFIIFPLYFLLIFTICIISYFTKIFLKRDYELTKPIFLTFSKNQSKVAEIFKKSSEEIYINFLNFEIKSKSFESNNLIYFYLSNGISINFLISIFKIKSIKYFKINWFRIVNLVILEKILNKNFLDHKLIVLANDHSIYNNFLIEFCKKENIKLMYIQHAPVTLNFPKLRCDYNILFSQSSYDIYNQISLIKKDYEIISDLRLIKYNNLKSNKLISKKSILVCTNELDSIDETNNFISFFLKKGYCVTIRKHPADRREWNISGTKLSKNELVIDFKDNFIVLCNETALILEAIVSNKLVYKCSFSKFFDNYGYFKNNLIIKEYSNPHDLKIDIDNEFVAYDKSKLNYYTGDLLHYKSQINKINNLISLHK